MGKRYVVTGGAGFIGSHVVRALVRQGNLVAVVDDLSTGDVSRLDGLTQVELVRGDVRDQSLVLRVSRGADGVFHQAAIASVARSVEDPVAVNAVNVEGTLSVLLAAQRNRVRRVVIASSSSVYGDQQSPVLSEDLVCFPRSPYAASKLSVEAYAKCFNAMGQTEAVCLRYFNVFGPGQSPDSEYAAVIPTFLTAAMSSGNVTIHGSGEQHRDFIYISDVVGANLKAMNSPGIGGESFNVGTGRAVSINQLASVISEVSQRILTRSHVQKRPGDIRHSLSDTSKARSRLGFAAEVELEQGLRHTLTWMKQRASTT